jgi:hypothetical protein
VSALPHHRPDPLVSQYEALLLELADLQEQVITAEMELEGLEHELHAFEGYYLGRVQHLHALLDALEVESLEVWLAHVRATQPGDAEASEELLQEAQARARESADCIPPDPPERFERCEPTEDATRLYREIARRIHPDLARDEVQAQVRHSFMCELNVAYRAGDVERMQAVSDTWESSAVAPDEDIEEAVARLRRQLARAHGRIGELREKLEELRGSELHELYQRTCEAGVHGRDLVEEIVEDLERQIEEARADLARLREEVAS